MTPGYLLPPALALTLLPAVFGGTAAAQTPVTGACGQPAALASRIGSVLHDGFPQQRLHLIPRRNEPHYVEFTLDSAQDVTLSTDTLDADPVLSVYDSTGALLGWDDDGGIGRNAFLGLSLAAGTYCAQVRTLDIAPLELIEIELTLDSGLFDPPGADGAYLDSGEIPCGDPATTYDFASGLGERSAPVSLEGEIPGEDGQSWYRLGVDAPIWLRLDARSVDFDTMLSVHDADGWEIFSNDDFTGTDSRIEEAFEPGNYCIGLRGFAGGWGTYSLAATVLDEAPPALLGPCGDPDRTEHLADNLIPGQPVRTSGQHLDPDTLQRWFSFSLDGARDIGLEARSDTFDTVLELYDAAGEWVDGNDDGFITGTNSLIEAGLAPGDYCVVLRGFGRSDGDFTLALEASGGEGPSDLPDLPDPATAQDIEELGQADTVLSSQRMSPDPTLWAAFSLAGPGTVGITGASVTSGFTLALFDADGTPIDSSDLRPAFSTVDIVADLTAGRYLVALTNLGGEDQLKLRQITVTPY